jgi:hypothetical protein
MRRITTAEAMILALSIFAAGCGDPPQDRRTDRGLEPTTTGATPVPDRLSAFAPTTAQRAEVTHTLQRLFDALRDGDEALLRSVMDESVVMHFTETRDGATTSGSSTVGGLASRITGGGDPLIERMWDPIVVVSGALATIWTPYDFYVGETFSHCGVDSANLIRTQDGWKIVALSWTRLQPPACELHPDGPPTG